MLVPVINPRGVANVTRLAQEIWSEHCHTIVGKEQAAYMLNKMQSEEAINYQIEKQGVRYFLISPYLDPIGYVAVVPLGSAIFISKMYIMWHYRGKGYGERVLEEIALVAKELHKPRITLRVPQNNTQALSFFHNNGFKEAGHKKISLGEGYELEYTLMAKLL